MPPKPTRSSARLSSNSHLSTALPTPPDPAPDPQVSRKRKHSHNPPKSPEAPETAEQLPQKSKRSRKSTSQHTADPDPEPPRKRTRTRAKTDMSSPDHSASRIDGDGSPPPISSSSKRRSGSRKNLKSNSPTDDLPAPSSSTSKKSKSSGSKRRSSSRRDAVSEEDAETSAQDRLDNPPAEDPDDNGLAGDEDDNADDDPFASGLFGRRGGGGFSSTLRALSGMMSGQTARLRGLLDSLKRKDDPSEQFVALTELSEILLVSTEDNLAGHFSPEPYVKELIRLMQPGDGFGNPEMMLLACRCIANLIEALPAATAAVVYSGAVPVLISQLQNIEYMDLAEQALITLEKISSEFPASIVRENGLKPCLEYLDFFATSVQRTAVTTAANCCRNIAEESFPMIKDIMPNLLGVLNSSDQKVVEQGSLCISRIAESFRHQQDKLEQLMSADLLRALLRLLLPGSTNLVSPHIHTQFLRVLSYTAKASPTLAMELFKMNITDTLYQILTGVSPPEDDENAAQKIDSVVVMQALIHRPRDQVFETLNVICELLPGLDHESLAFVHDLATMTNASADATMIKAKESTIHKRMAMLDQCKKELRRFTTILLPTLTDAYSSTVNLSVRQRVLTAQLKMLSNLDQNILEEALKAVPYASYLASILSQQDHPILVVMALQAADLLLQRLGPIYRYQFYREGVIAEVRKLADRPVEEVEQTATHPSPPNASQASNPEPASALEDQTNTATGAEVDMDAEDHSDDDEDPEIMGEGGDDMSEDESSDGEHPPEPPTSLLTRNTLKDAVTRLAKKFIAQYENASTAGMREKASQTLDDLHSLVAEISDCYEFGRIEEGSKLFAKLATSFEGNALESITSYELLSSGVVETLLEVFHARRGKSNVDARAAFIEAFMGSTVSNSLKTTSSSSPSTPFSILVNKLQDLLSRAEHFEVVTVHSNPHDSNRTSAASMLAKQVRIKLVAEGGDDSGIPMPFRNIMVSIHAIATLKALDEYLRPRMSMVERGPSVRHGDRSSSSRAALAAAMASLDGPDAFLARRFGGMTAPPPASNPSSTLRSTSSAGKSSAAKSTDPITSTQDDPSGSAEPRVTSASRRSMRRSGSGASKPGEAMDSENAEPVTEQSGSQNTLECADETALQDDDELEETEALEAVLDEFEEEVDDEEAPDPSAVNLDVAPTGKVTARKEDGTRVATPTGARDASTAQRVTTARPPLSSMARSLLAFGNQSMSYSAAVQSVPSDWHLAFSVNGQAISSDTTVYRAIHSTSAPREETSGRNVWSNVHSISFKKVPGPPPTESSPVTLPSLSPVATTSGLPESLDKNPTTALILRLLHILHEMNANLDDVLNEDRTSVKVNAEPLAAFVNTKLTAKINRQLEEPLIVASNSLPSWSEDLARLYPFLFPFETRHLFLQSTSFGYSRSITRWQNAQTGNDSRRDRHRDERPFLGRLQRQKVRISRGRLLESAIKVMELYGASPSILEVEYFEEVGTGLGPTLEFYSNVSKEFSKKKLRLWRENESNANDDYAFGKCGLFPAPMSESQAQSENGKRVLMLFKALGKFVARSMLDSRIIDVSFNPTFFRVNGGASAVPLSLGAVKAVDSDLAKSLQMLKQFTAAKKKIVEKPSLTAAQKAQKISRIQVAGASIDDLGLDFTLPGYPAIELVPNGSNTAVGIDNVGMYVDKVISFTLGEGVQRQIEAFREGFSEVFPYSALRAFTPDELVMLFGRVEEDWSMEILTDSIKADHGYNLDSRTVQNLLRVISELDPTSRRDFLQFVTGSPKLPIGGFKSLTPMFTVVLRPSEPGHLPDEYLPSCMTCVNYLKMPDYSSLEVMREKLGIAIKEGQGAFHLS